MPRISRMLSTACIGLALAAVAGDAAIAQPQPGRRSGEVIRAWSEIARSQAFGNPILLSRVLAIMHAAQHDAVNGAEPRYETYASRLSDRKRRRGSGRCGCRTPGPRRLLPGEPGSAGRRARGLARGRSRRPGRDARAWRSAGQWASASSTCGRTTGSTFQIRSLRRRDRESGSRPLRRSRRCSKPSSRTSARSRSRDRSQFLPDPPPDLTSARYARDFNEVKRLGQDTSPLRTADQTAAGPLLGRGLARRLEPHREHRLGAPGLRPASDRAAARPAEHGDGRRIRHRLVPEAALRVLAAGDGDPEGRRPTATAAPAPTRTGCRFVRRRPSRTTRRPTASSEPRRPRSCAGSPETDHFRFCMASTTAVPAGAERCWNSFTQAELENAGLAGGWSASTSASPASRAWRWDARSGRFAIRHSLRPLHQRR